MGENQHKERVCKDGRLVNHRSLHFKNGKRSNGALEKAMLWTSGRHTEADRNSNG